MAVTHFTKADRDRLETLLRKQREAKADERKAFRQKDKICKELFGLGIGEIKEKLDNDNMYFNMYDDLRSRVTELMKLSGKNFEDFDKFVDDMKIKTDNRNDYLN